MGGKSLLGVLLVFVAVFFGVLLKTTNEKKAIIGPSGFGWKSTAEEVAGDMDLTGKVALVTGASSGLGLETSRVLALRGAQVVVAARSLDKANTAISEIRVALGEQGSQAKLTPLAVELGSIASIEASAKAFTETRLPLHLLINNAGVMGLQKEQRTSDGLEMQMGVNHIGHFHFTNLLMDHLVASQPSRVIVLSSAAHRWVNPEFLKSPELSTAYDPFPVYANTKWANIMHARELNERYASQGVHSYSLHPGGIMTNLARDINPKHMLKTMGLKKMFELMPMLKSVEAGSATTVYAALKASEADAGSYYEDCNVAVPLFNDLIENAQVRKYFWETSEAIVSDLRKRA